MLKKTRIFVVIIFLFAVLIFAMYHLTRTATMDRTIPVIEMDSESISVSVKSGDSAILEGVTAKDGKDGDITNQLFIESKSAFIEKGKFNVTIAVADKDNHVVKRTREVIYSDYRSPQFSLSRPLKFQSASESRDDLNIAANLSANDVIDGNISNKIKISSDYSIYGSGNITGDYPMEFIVTNSMGDIVKLPVTITIYNALEENGLPEIVLSSYLINTPVGERVDIYSYVKQIVYRNEIYKCAEDGNFYNGEYDALGNPEGFASSAIKIDEDIEWDKPGTYEVTITFSDESTDISNFTRCYVVVY